MNHRGYFPDGDGNVHLLPRTPDGATGLPALRRSIFDAPVVEGSRVAGGDPEEVQHIGIGAGIHLLVGPGDGQAGQFLKTVQVRAVSIQYRLLVDVGLQQFLLEVLEQGCLVIPQVREEVVFRPQEHLAIGFPDPVMHPPFPLVARHLGGLDVHVSCPVLLEVHQHTVDIHLRA
ncbi:hypothetical protein BJQ89_03245 [Arthrobacter sp. ES1]|nr:hypothetical protein [Arthrobacter sp. ES1]